MADDEVADFCMAERVYVALCATTKTSPGLPDDIPARSALVIAGLFLARGMRRHAMAAARRGESLIEQMIYDDESTD